MSNQRSPALAPGTAPTSARCAGRRRGRVSMLLLVVACALGFAALAVARPGQQASGDGASDVRTSAGQLSAGDAADETPEEPPTRVLITINRNETVAGTIQLEDENLIVVRNERGKARSFLKTRILDLVRLVDPSPGQTGSVVLRNGQVRTGVILADEFDHVLVEIEGVRARFPRSAVHSVVLDPTFEQRYDELKSRIDPRMTEAQLQLCRWLHSEGRFELALEELDALLAEADSRDARELRDLVRAQLELQREREAEALAMAGGETDQAGAEGEDPLERGQRSDLLSASDVNVIRVYEVDLKDPPVIRIPDEAIRRLIQRHGTDPLVPANRADRARMFRADQETKLSVLELMFRLRARDLYPRVQVVTEPASLLMFKQRVHDAWLVKNCATSECHGTRGLGGRFFLHRENHRNPRVRYTNLLLLERTELVAERPLIDYDEPEMSLIIQHALPRAFARLPHPEVPGWRPVFSRSREVLLDQSIEWIESMMYPRPEYPVVLPGERAAEPAESGRDRPDDGR